jgi:hypothetical protein
VSGDRSIAQAPARSWSGESGNGWLAAVISKVPRGVRIIETGIASTEKGIEIVEGMMFA